MLRYALLGVWLLVVAYALPTAGSLSASVEPLHIFPNSTAAESLYVRDDGSVLLGTLTPSALLYYLPSSNYSNPILLHNFTGFASTYGITEYAPDIFAVVTGTFSRTGTVTNATGVVWSIDLNGLEVFENESTTSSVPVSRLTNLTNVGFLNGATTLDRNTVLVADSAIGVVYSINTQNGESTVALNDTTMFPNASGAVRLGVNGLRMLNDTLYYTNTNHGSVCKVRLHANGTAAGSYDTIATNVLVDDLEVHPYTGAVYLPSLVGNAITYIAPNGKSTIIAGSLNSTDVPGPTSIRFAKSPRHPGDQRTDLYIATSGGVEYPINGSYVMGGGLYELIAY